MAEYCPYMTSVAPLLLTLILSPNRCGYVSSIPQNLCMQCICHTFSHSTNINRCQNGQIDNRRKMRATVYRAPGKWDIEDNFSYFSMKTYAATPHLNHFDETVLKMGHKICFNSVWMIIPTLSLSPHLILSTVNSQFLAHQGPVVQN